MQGDDLLEKAFPDILKREVGHLGIELSLAQLEQFQRYYYELNEWNSRVNLTSVTEWEDVQLKHYLDSLTVALVIPETVLGSGRFVDVGHRCRRWAARSARPAGLRWARPAP